MKKCTPTCLACQFFSAVGQNEESVCLELDLLKDQVILNSDPELPAEALVETYRLLHHLQHLVKNLSETPCSEACDYMDSNL